MLIIGGVMLMVGGGVIMLIVSARQFLKLKYKFKAWRQYGLQRHRMPVLVDGELIEMSTVKYFEPVEFSAFEDGLLAVDRLSLLFSPEV